MRFFLLLVAAVTVLESTNAFAYDSNVTDEIRYVQASHIRAGLGAFATETQPSDCGHEHFIPADGVTDEGRQAMLSVALAAFVAGKPVRIYYVEDPAYKCKVEYLRIVNE